MVKCEHDIKIECENKDDGDIVLVEIVKVIKRLSNERKLKGAIIYGKYSHI